MQHEIELASIGGFLQYQPLELRMMLRAELVEATSVRSAVQSESEPFFRPEIELGETTNLKWLPGKGWISYNLR